MLKINLLLENEEAVQHRHEVEALCDTSIEVPRPGEAIKVNWTLSYWESGQEVPLMRYVLRLIRATHCKVEYAEVGLREHVAKVKACYKLARQIETACEVRKLKHPWFFPRLRALLRLWRNS